MARTMRAVEVTKPGTPFRLVERPIPDPARAQVRIAVEACGICHSDAYLKEGHFPGVVYPRVGGHGHLGIQYARKLGFRTVALSRGADKRALALELGAHEYIDTDKGDPAAALQKLGGARVILATAPSAQLSGKLVDGLARNGTLLVLGATPEPIQVSPFQLIGKRRRIQGWPSGTPKDSEETLAFSALSGVASRNEVFPLDKVEEAYQRMIGNTARLRVVLQVRK